MSCPWIKNRILTKNVQVQLAEPSGSTPQVLQNFKTWRYAQDSRFRLFVGAWHMAPNGRILEDISWLVCTPLQKRNSSKKSLPVSANFLANSSVAPSWMLSWVTPRMCKCCADESFEVTSPLSSQPEEDGITILHGILCKLGAPQRIALNYFWPMWATSEQPIEIISDESVLI